MLPFAPAKTPEHQTRTRKPCPPKSRPPPLPQRRWRRQSMSSSTLTRKCAFTTVRVSFGVAAVSAVCVGCVVLKMACGHTDRVFPYDVMYQWLSYGNSGKDSSVSEAFCRREFSFTLKDDIYIRFLSDSRTC